MSIESVMPSNHLILCHPLLLLPSFFPSIRIFSNESVLPIRWPKYWNLSFSISLSNEYSGLISFRIEWFDLLVVQGTLKSLLQNHSSEHWFHLPHHSARPPPQIMSLLYTVKLIMFPLWLVFYFLSGYWLWKMLNIFYYCDYVTITHLTPFYYDWSTENNRTLYHQNRI